MMVENENPTLYDLGRTVNPSHSRIAVKNVITPAIYVKIWRKGLTYSTISGSF
jgi:hypothetical protein